MLFQTNLQERDSTTELLSGEETKQTWNKLLPPPLTLLVIFASTLSRYECEPGYERSGLPTLLCQSNGTWSSFVPTCTRMKCFNFPEIENGFIEDESKSYYFQVLHNYRYLITNRHLVDFQSFLFISFSYFLTLYSLGSCLCPVSKGFPSGWY